MADFSATFAANNLCTLQNTGGINALCFEDCGRNSLRRLNKNRRKRARHTAGSSCGCRHCR